jgi:hypothetical protein
MGSATLSLFHACERFEAGSLARGQDLMVCAVVARTVVFLHHGSLLPLGWCPATLAPGSIPGSGFNRPKRR